MSMKIPRIELELVLVRHGETKWNVEHRYLGHTDLPLLPSATRHMTELSGDFWRVFCSDLLRCKETLAYIAPSVEKRAVYDQRLREMNFGLWEGCTYEQLKDNSLYRAWIDDPSMVTPPEGESWGQFEERLSGFLFDLGVAVDSLYGNGVITKHNHSPFTDESITEDATQPLALQNTTNSPPQRVLIVTHGGVIRKLIAQLVPGITFYSAAAPSPGTAVILKLFWQNGQWSADLSEAI